MRDKNNHEGFSLFETLIALALIAIMLTILLNYHSLQDKSFIICQKQALVNREFSRLRENWLVSSNDTSLLQQFRIIIKKKIPKANITIHSSSAVTKIITVEWSTLFKTKMTMSVELVHAS